MKTLRIHGLLRLGALATMMVLCVAIGVLGTEQRAEGWSAGILDGAGGAHGMMAGNVIEWLDNNNWLPTSPDWLLARDGASAPDSIWNGPNMKWDDWWKGAEMLQIMIGRDIVTCGFEGFPPSWTCQCKDELCFTLKDDWEELMDHRSDRWVYWIDVAKSEVATNPARAMIHAGYAMHFAMDHLNPAHLGGWGLAEPEWEGVDSSYVDKAWADSNFNLMGRCFASDSALHMTIVSDLVSYRYSNALAWPTPPNNAWILWQAQDFVRLDGRITNAVEWSEQVSQKILQYVFNLTPPGGCISSSQIPIAYVYSSWGMRTMQDEMSRLSSLEPGKYQFSSYNESTINNLWPSLSNYRILLIDEDSFYSDGSWSRYGGPLYNSFKSQAAELESFVKNGGAIFTSGENDLFRTQAWDWLPPGMQVTSYDPERTSSVHIVNDPGWPRGLYSYPNTITDSYLSRGHTHAWFTAWDPGYTTTVRRNDNNQTIELYGVFGKGAIVASHVEAEAGYAWEYLQNQLRFIKAPDQYWMDILWPYPGAQFALGQEIRISVAIRDTNGNFVSGATVSTNSPSGVPIPLVETYISARTTLTSTAASVASMALGGTQDSPEIIIYQGIYTILPTDPIGEWAMGVIASVGGEFPKQAISVQISANRPPVADAGPDQVAMVGNNCLSTLTLNGTGSSDPDGDPLIYTWAGPFGTVSGPTPTVDLYLGIHTITLTVNDGKGGAASDTVNVTVLDKTPPIITSLSVNPSVLWPPNHQMVPVTFNVSAADNCDPNRVCKNISIVSNEPENGLGDGDTAPDWQITGDLTSNLRAERSGKRSGRVYTMTIKCTDASGNSSMANVSVNVPRDQGK